MRKYRFYHGGNARHKKFNSEIGNILFVYPVGMDYIKIGSAISVSAALGSIISILFPTLELQWLKDSMRMQILNNLSIKRKLIVLITGATFTSLAVSFSVVAYYQVQTFQRDAIERGALQAQLLGEYCAPAIDFKDNAGARETLSKMDAVSSVLLVAILDTSGREFSAYRRNHFAVAGKKAERDHNEFLYGLLHIHRRIVYKGVEYGSVYLVATTEEMQSKINRFIFTMTWIGIVILVGTYLLAQRLQGILSKPILELAEATERVKKSGDYTLRVTRDAKDEISVLYDGFNAMLEVIQERKEERVLAEKNLASEKERLLVTLRSIGDGVITTDMDGQVVLMNDAAEKLTGWKQAEAFGQKLKAVFHIVDQIEKENIILTKIMGLSELSDQRKVLISRDGSEKIISDSVSLIHQTDGKPIGVVIAFRDVTDKLKMDAEILKARKIESVGILAGGIAHDFNNILTSIIGNLGLVRMSAKNHETEAVIEGIREAEKAALRAKDLTRQLLTFAKGGAPIRRSMLLADLVRDATTFALRGSNVSLSLDIPDNLPAIDADEGQISQVINNLIINAKQAMPGGGVIAVGVCEVSQLQTMAQYGLQIRPGRYLKISISDQGAGIPPEYVDKIFDPYFTTKETGTGLGLTSCYSIVKNHTGLITMTSAINLGTTFEIYLPVTEKRSYVDATPLTSGPNGHGKILIMDDEEIIREMAVKILSKFGYTVESANEGEDAIKKYSEAMKKNVPFDVVILDLTIPGGMGGKEAISKLRELDENVVLIVSSGYSNDAIMAQPEKFGVAAVLTKPYTIETMSGVIQQAMESKS